MSEHTHKRRERWLAIADMQTEERARKAALAIAHQTPGWERDPVCLLLVTVVEMEEARHAPAA